MRSLGFVLGIVAGLMFVGVVVKASFIDNAVDIGTIYLLCISIWMSLMSGRMIDNFK